MKLLQQDAHVRQEGLCCGWDNLYRFRGAVDAGARTAVRGGCPSIASCGRDDFSADEADSAEEFFYLKSDL
jgi:hypothetical protein